MFSQVSVPIINEALGARIAYVHAEPYRAAPILATGTITWLEQRGPVTHLFVKPDDQRLLPKWRTEHHVLDYAVQEVN
jgi:hypothetical protein